MSLTIAPKTPYKLKYRNQPLVVDGIRFDSQREHRHWCVLRLREKAGEITRLERQVRFDIVINGKKCGSWRADFVYFEGNRRVVADAKGAATSKEKHWRFKKKVLEALFGFEIQEV